MGMILPLSSCKNSVLSQTAKLFSTKAQSSVHPHGWARLAPLEPEAFQCSQKEASKKDTPPPRLTGLTPFPREAL